MSDFVQSLSKSPSSETKLSFLSAKRLRMLVLSEPIWELGNRLALVLCSVSFI